MVLPCQHVPVGIERPDVDGAVGHGPEDAPCGDEIADAAPVQARPVAASMGQKMMAQRVEARMRVLDSPADGAAEGVGEGLEGRIVAHDQIGSVDRLTLRPGRGGDGRRQRHDIGNPRGLMYTERSEAAIAVDERPVSDEFRGGFGEPSWRREDARMLKGAGRYVPNLPVPDCLALAFVRSPLARAAINRLAVEAARAAPGVAAVYTGRDVAGLPRPRVNPILGDFDAPDMPILAERDLRAVGQPVVAIVAESDVAALEAADRIEMELEPLEAVCDPEAAVDASPLFPGIGSNVIVDKRWRSGEPDRAFGGAAITAEVVVRHPRVAPAPLECRSALAQWDRATKHLTIRCGTQTPHRARDDIARALGLRNDQVRAITPDVGGAFGMKASIYPEDIAVAYASRDLCRPVRWIASRQEDFLAASHGRGAVCRGRMALDAAGRILALQADLTFPLGAWLTFSAFVPAWNAGRILPGPYMIDDVDIRVRAVVTNTAPVGIYRGASRPEAAMLLERLVEVGARKAGLDPVAVRQRNLVSSELLPFSRPCGTTLDSGDYRGLLARTLVLADYGRMRSAQRRRRDRDELMGLGWSFYVEPCGQGWESASVTLNRDGRFTVATGSSTQGQGRETTFAQIAARELDVSHDAVDVVHGDTAATRAGVGALASRSVAIGGSAVLRAARALVDKARTVGAALLAVGPSSLLCVDGGLSVAGRPDRAVTWNRIASSVPASLRAEVIYTPTARHGGAAAVSRRCRSIG